MSVTRINEFKASDGMADELFLFLKSLLPYITSSDGCLSCEILRANDAPDNFVILEKWDSIESHLKSIDGFPPEEMQAALPLFAAPPNGAYYHNGE